MLCTDSAPNKWSYSEATSGSWELLEPQKTSQAATTHQFPTQPQGGPNTPAPHAYPAALPDCGQWVCANHFPISELAWTHLPSPNISIQGISHSTIQAYSATELNLQHGIQENTTPSLTSRSAWRPWLASESWTPPLELECAEATQYTPSMLRILVQELWK